MFNESVNTPCKQLVENGGMHESAKRLYEAALVISRISRQGDVADFAGVTPQVLTNWESRGVSKAGRLSLLSKHGINPDWLATGKGAMLATPSTLEGAPVRALAEGEDPGDGYVQIPEYEVRFAAGNGRTALFDEIDGTKPRTYRVEWFAAAGINPAHAKCFKVHGDSMEPMLFDGDSVLVNLAETEISNGKVYAIRYGDELRIKRCYKRLDGGLVLRSDNPSFLPRDEEINPEIAAEHITILGRVRDKSGSGGL